MPMNKIEKLIKELCPNGVEWKKLGEVCQVLRGKRLTKSQLSETAKYKVYHGGIEPIGFYDKKNRDADSVMIINVGASAGTIGYSYEDFWSSDGCFCISHSYIFCNRFLYYYLISIEHVIIAKVRHAGIPTLDSKVIENIEIPLPPLPIQTEIVRILDKFVEQQEQLERLIELRKKQYEYYREEMLKPKEGEKWETKTLGEICTITRGKRLTKSQLSETAKYKVYHGGIDPIGYYKECNRKADTVMVINVGASAGTIGYSNEDFWSSDGCFCLSHTDIALSRFLYYSLLEVGYIIESRVRHAGIPTLDSKVLEELMINIPSKQKQNTIINSLKEFESSISALTSALELSKKRYEYYRDKMLRF